MRWLIRTKRRRFWLAMLGLYILFFMFGGCADRLLLFPTTDRLDAPGATRRTIPFDGGELEIYTARSPGCAGREPQAYVLSFTGNGGRVEMSTQYDAADWGDKPIELWAVNHPGFGGSTGPAKLRRLAPAALVAYDALAQHARGKPVFVHGMSLGSTMALHVAANRPVAGALIRTPPPLRQMIMGKYGWWNLWLVATPVALGVPPELSALASAAVVKAPAVFVLIETDEIVPVSYQRRVLDAYAGEKHSVMVDQGDHNMLLDRAAAAKLRAQLDWLWNVAGLK